MSIKELNDFKIKDLPTVLRPETLMEGYWSLIPDAIANCNRLHAAGIRKASDLWEIHDNPQEFQSLIRKTGIPGEYLQRLNGILTFNRFKPFPLKKIENINPKHLKSLELEGIKETGALLLAGRTKVMRKELARKTDIPESDLEYLLKLADLMRMPGVKTIRAKLYIDAGIDCVATFSAQQPDQMRAFMLEFVKKTKTTRTAPLPKEIATGIAWAKIMPVVVIF